MDLAWYKQDNFLAGIKAGTKMWPSRKTSPIQMTTGNNYPSIFCLSGLQKCTHLSVTARCSFLPAEIWNNFGAFLESVHNQWIHLDQLFLLNDISHSITDSKWVHGWSTTHLRCFLSSFGSFLMRCCSETHFGGGRWQAPSTQTRGHVILGYT